MGGYAGLCTSGLQGVCGAQVHKSVANWQGEHPRGLPCNVAQWTGAQDLRALFLKFQAPHLEVQPQLRKHLLLQRDQLLVQRVTLLRRAQHKQLHLGELVHAVQALACMWGVYVGRGPGMDTWGPYGTQGFTRWQYPTQC